MRALFAKLKAGKAVFGNPGIGCAGPYGVSRFLIEAEEGVVTRAKQWTSADLRGSASLAVIGFFIEIAALIVIACILTAIFD
jgi:hypothetical protein